MSRALLLGPIDPMGGRSIVVPPPVQGDPEGLRTAARQLEQAAVALDQVVVTARMVVFHLTSAGGWRGPAANAFSDGAVEPASQALSGIARELERVAAALRGGANAIEEAQAERRHAENLAIVAGVGVALTLLTFAVSDVLAADAAATASALMVRAAAAAASAGRAVSAAVEAAEEAIASLAGRLATMGPGLLGAVATVERVLESPVGSGAVSAGVTAALGDRNPRDLVFAFAMSYVAGAAETGSMLVTDAMPAEVCLIADLNAAQAANFLRFTRRLPAGAEPPDIVRYVTGTVRYAARVPGRVPGSSATYVKYVDSSGNTLDYFKITLAPDGSIISTKNKMRAE
jgi:uncharacterized protein YukE